jgi:hypothetical protein
MTARELEYYVCVTVMYCYSTLGYRFTVMCCVTVMCCYNTVGCWVTVTRVCYCNVLLQYSLSTAVPFTGRK